MRSFLAIYNPGHNILNILVQFALSKTKTLVSALTNLIYELSHKLLNTWRKYNTNLKLERRHSQVPSLPSWNSTLVIPAKQTCKSRYQMFLVLSNFTGFLYFIQKILSGIVVLLPLYFKFHYNKFFQKKTSYQLSYHAILPIWHLDESFNIH